MKRSAVPYQHITAILDGLRVRQVILFLDEPALGQVGFDYQRLWSALFESFPVTPGVHVCGNMNWDDLFRSSVEIISFDASTYDITKYPAYRNGKRIAWGVQSRENVKDFRDGDLLTLPCGMGPKFYTPADCDASLKKLLEISTRPPGGVLDSKGPALKPRERDGFHWPLPSSDSLGRKAGKNLFPPGPVSSTVDSACGRKGGTHGVPGL